VTPPDRRILPLQGLRFFAALHVVLLHTFGATWLPETLDRLVRWGGSTASLFFILSGFVLTLAYALPGGGLRLRDRVFWGRRAARLFPLGILSHLLVVPLVWWTYAADERWLRAALTTVGLQAFWPPFAGSFNSPGWSLSFLALGFALLPTAVRWTAAWSPRALALAALALWLTMLAPAAAYVAAAPGAGFWQTALYTFPVVRLPEFLFGVVLARLLRARSWPAPPPWLASVALAALVAGTLAAPDALFPVSHNGLFAPLHGVLLWSLAYGGGALGRLLSWRVACRLGEASFALYLLHVPLHAWMSGLAGGGVAGWGTPASAAFFLSFLVGAIVLSDVVERWFVAPIARGWSSPTVAPAPRPT
jgi:peptidoglycan/LPS O-acetylase OafA/YrhL